MTSSDDFPRFFFCPPTLPDIALDDDNAYGSQHTIQSLLNFFDIHLTRIWGKVLLSTTSVPVPIDDRWAVRYSLFFPLYLRCSNFELGRNRPKGIEVPGAVQWLIDFAHLNIHNPPPATRTKACPPVVFANGPRRRPHLMLFNSCSILFMDPHRQRGPGAIFLRPRRPSMTWTIQWHLPKVRHLSFFLL